MTSIINFVYKDSDPETLRITVENGIPKCNDKAFPDWGKEIDDLDEDVSDLYYDLINEGEDDQIAKMHAWIFYNNLELDALESAPVVGLLDYVVIRMIQNPGWNANLTVRDEVEVINGNKKVKLPTTGSEFAMTDLDARFKKLFNEL